MTKFLTMSAVLLAAGTAAARPVIDSAEVNLRIFNDIPGSTTTVVNAYPSVVSISDQNVSGGGFANRHNFRLATGGVGATFNNNDGFAFSADVTITGVAASEGGLNLSPWWSQNVDGNFMLNTSSGEIAVFGGRLPFYSFTGNHGITYTAGQTARLGIAYDPRGLNAGAPGVIRYFVTLGGTEYSSPYIFFDQGNPAEDPPYGLWGILNDARLGGYFQIRGDNGNPANGGAISWENMQFVPAPAAGVFAVGGLMGLARRRR